MYTKSSWDHDCCLSFPEMSNTILEISKVQFVTPTLIGLVGYTYHVGGSIGGLQAHAEKNEAAAIQKSHRFWPIQRTSLKKLDWWAKRSTYPGPLTLNQFSEALESALGLGVDKLDIPLFKQRKIHASDKTVELLPKRLKLVRSVLD